MPSFFLTVFIVLTAATAKSHYFHAIPKPEQFFSKQILYGFVMFFSQYNVMAVTKAKHENEIFLNI